MAGLVATLTYTYDAQGRKVTETNAKKHMISYTYDDAGNLTQVSLNGTVQKTSTYDLANRLITSRDGNGNTTQFKYNKLGKIKEVVYPGDASIDANTVIYKFDKVGNLVYDANSMGKKTLSTFDALGRPTSVTVKDGEDHTLQNKAVAYDVLGNVRFETDPMDR